MRHLHATQRIALAAFALWAGAAAILTLILPKWTAHELFSTNLSAPQILFWQLYGGARLGLALTALVAAWVPKPPRALVLAIALALAVEVIGPIFSLLVSAIGAPDLKPYLKWIYADGLFAAILFGTQAARRILR